MSETRLSFERYEKKYLLSPAQYEALLPRLEGRIEPDEYHRSTVCSIYYDSPDYRLIRNSIEEPVYKEKLRLRSYNVPRPEDTVFLELKKKYGGIVYKRRVGMSAREAALYLAGKAAAPEDGQVLREIDWFMRVNRPVPMVFIACDRTAYRVKDEPELRITFDRDIRWRESELELTRGSHGKALLPGGQLLMETKIPGSAPLWMAELFSELGVFPTGFSKYGVCYKDNLLMKYVNGVILSV
ncbi:MAG: polyphosphate polymerase domain-containing protein [Oscillospiraceae bacterium]|nr:polyphosphate polymerase domain-containing protein [Oscillospiraceae bacterium]